MWRDSATHQRITKYCFLFAFLLAHRLILNRLIYTYKCNEREIIVVNALFFTSRLFTTIDTFSCLSIGICVCMSHNVIVLTEPSLEYFCVLMFKIEKRTRKKKKFVVSSVRSLASSRLMTKVAYKISLDLDMWHDDYHYAVRGVPSTLFREFFESRCFLFASKGIFPSAVAGEEQRIDWLDRFLVSSCCCRTYLDCWLFFLIWSASSLSSSAYWWWRNVALYTKRRVRSSIITCSYDARYDIADVEKVRVSKQIILNWFRFKLIFGQIS